MDEPGWHARRRAQQEAETYARPRKDSRGHFKAVEEALPTNAPWSDDGPLGPDENADTTAPPPPPPKDSRTEFPVQPQPALQGVSSSYAEYRPLGASAPMIPGQSQKLPRTEVKQMSPIERTAVSIAPPIMKPHLQCMCGPLLKYDTVDTQGIYHGACLLVTSDAGSKYDPHPFMTLEWDPEADASTDASNEESAFTQSSSTKHRQKQSISISKHIPLTPHPSSPFPVISAAWHANGATNGTLFSPSAQTLTVEGEELWVYDSRGGTFTFWRFTFQIPLTLVQVQVHYSVNQGQKMSFFVPGRTQDMNWAAHSCNGFSAGVNPDDFRGPGFESGYDPVWTDLLRRHNEKPFHVLVGGGDQVYCDKMMREPELQEWVKIKTPEQRMGFRLTEDIELAIDRFYFSHYCNAFRQGAFARANSTIPMLNMLDDHDLIDGFGSYPDDLQNSDMFRAIGTRGYFYFLLFQCFTNDEKDKTNSTSPISSIRSFVIGGDGPYINYPSHSILTYLGPKVWMLLLDCRAERKKNQVCSELEYTRVFERMETIPDGIEHLVVQIGIPIAYPRMNFLEHALESRFNPITAISKTGTMAKNFVNKFNADAELLDDLNDHWTATPHKKERNWLVEQLQHFALKKKLRITFLSGDVHCAAVGLFKTLSKRRGETIEPINDHRYMLNVVTSAIVNTPPPNGVLTMVSFLAPRKHRTLHSAQTDEVMVPLFGKEPNGTKAKSKYVAGRRNYTAVHRDARSGDLVFDIRLEIERGMGETASYPIGAPPPKWNP